VVLLNAIVAGRIRIARFVGALVGGVVAFRILVPALMAFVRRTGKCGPKGAGTSFSKQGVGCLPHLADR
jgi:hypothetical protein